MSNLIIKACYTAAYYHGVKQQKRKYTGLPYIVHPAEVVDLLLNHVFTTRAPIPEVIAAAWMHDLLEDCSDVYSEEMMRKDFGDNVTDLVLEVTDISRPEDGNRAWRKTLDRAHIAKASYDGQCIKIADMISNTRDIIVNDLKFAATYIPEKRALLRVLSNSPPHFLMMAEQEVLKAERVLENETK